MLSKVNLVIFQLYNGENKLHFDDMNDDDYYVYLDFHSARSLKYQSMDRHVAPIWNIISMLLLLRYAAPFPKWPVFTPTP